MVSSKARQKETAWDDAQEYLKTDLAQFFENLGLGIQIFDENLRLVYVNQTYLNYCGLKREDLEGKDFYELVFMVYKELDLEPINALSLSREFPIHARVHGVLHNGTRVTCKLSKSFVKDHNENVLAIVKVVEEEKRGHEASPIQAHHSPLFIGLVSELSGLFDDYPDGVLIFDRNLMLCYVNQSFEWLVGANQEQLLGQSWPEFTSQHHLLPDEDVLKRVMEGQEGRFCRESYALTVDGRRLACRIYLVPLRRGGSIQGMMTLVEEITEEKEAQARNELLGKFALIGDMAAGLANEVRNPMTAIRGMAQLLGEKYPTDIEAFNLIVEEVDRADRMVGNFLKLAENHPSHKRLINLSEVLKNSIDLIYGNIVSKGLTLRAEVSLDRKDWGFGDPQELNQAFLNLMNNAIEASLPGDEVRVEGLQSYHRWILKIIDRGYGVSQEILPKIFNPCFSTKENGTGLGLPMAFRIIKDHGGEIVINSLEGQGTEVIVTLPLVDAEVHD